MEKLPEFNSEGDIEDWLEIFECRAACSKIANEKTKIQWCRSVIGGVVDASWRASQKEAVGRRLNRN